VPEEKVRTWVSHYRLHGVAGLQPKRGAYTAQFKLQVLSHQDREQLSSRQVPELTTQAQSQADLLSLLQHSEASDLSLLVDYLTDSGKGRISMSTLTCSQLIAAQATNALHTCSSWALQTPQAQLLSLRFKPPSRREDLLLTR